jgi:hypothetical protein
MSRCTVCDTRTPLGANYCSVCGAALRETVAAPPGPGWEVRRVEVPLNVQDPGMDAQYRVLGGAPFEEYGHLVAARLREEAASGWEPLSPTDASAALVDGRIALTPESDGWHVAVWQSVTLVLRRRSEVPA